MLNPDLNILRLTQVGVLYINQGASDSELQLALDYACGQADCSAIQAGQSCWMPNSVTAHASYAMNSYYQKNLENAATCDFDGLATITTIDPSKLTTVHPL